jgi:hypothetical protein
VSGIFGVNPALYGMAPDNNILLVDFQLVSGGNPNLLLNDVQTGNHFRYRMFYLDTGIHFHKIKSPVLVNQEFHRPGIFIADRLSRPDCSLAHPVSQLGGQYSGRRFFDHLLISPLNGTIPFSQMNNIAEMIGQYLKFNMPRSCQVFFHIHGVIVESRFSFRFSHVVGLL